MKTQIPPFDLTQDRPMLPWTSDMLHGFSLDTTCAETRAWHHARNFVDKRTDGGFYRWSKKFFLFVQEPMQTNFNRGSGCLWSGRETLSDEHLIGTRAGVIRSRAVCRLQDSARQVPEAVSGFDFHTVGATSESSKDALACRDRRMRSLMQFEHGQSFWKPHSLAENSEVGNTTE